jgi:hypothetical protein
MIYIVIIPATIYHTDDIYHTLEIIMMNRPGTFEELTTLYVHYVEEQTTAMQEMLRRLSEDVGHFEGLSYAQPQLYRRPISDFERHSQGIDIE